MEKLNPLFLEEMKSVRTTNAIAIGEPGTGKNFRLKFDVLNEVRKGKKIRIWDGGDFTQFVKQLGGKTVSLDEMTYVENLNDEYGRNDNNE